MSVENYDGLCGVLALFARSDLQLRCKYKLCHTGDHSWEKYKDQFRIIGGSFKDPDQIAEEGFVNSVVSSQNKKEG